MDLDALEAQIGSVSSDCWIWTLWELRLLDLDALGPWLLKPWKKQKKSLKTKKKTHDFTNYENN